MKQILNYGDQRNERACCHCGDLFLHEGRAMDHIPSKILLDDPLPGNLHKAFCCKRCNSELAKDELYFACLIECVLAGSTELNRLTRDKVRLALERNGDVRAVIERSRRKTSNGIVFNPDWTRVNRIALKLARGHSSYELNEPKPEPPSRLYIKPLILMTEDERAAFETPPTTHLWPEVGSRKMLMLVQGDEDAVDGWTIVQEGRYRYLTSASPVTVRCVLSEYLAIEVVWGG